MSGRGRTLRRAREAVKGGGTDVQEGDVARLARELETQLPRPLRRYLGTGYGGGGGLVGGEPGGGGPGCLASTPITVASMATNRISATRSFRIIRSSVRRSLGIQCLASRGHRTKGGPREGDQSRWPAWPMRKPTSSGSTGLRLPVSPAKTSRNCPGTQGRGTYCTPQPRGADAHSKVWPRLYAGAWGRSRGGSLRGRRGRGERHGRRLHEPPPDARDAAAGGGAGSTGG